MISNLDTKVSIILPTYNREEVLCQTIEPALGQDYPAYEVIVVDQTKKHSLSAEKYLEHIKDKIRVILK